MSGSLLYSMVKSKETMGVLHRSWEAPTGPTVTVASHSPPAPLLCVLAVGSGLGSPPVLSFVNSEEHAISKQGGSF